MLIFPKRQSFILRIRAITSTAPRIARPPPYPRFAILEFISTVDKLLRITLIMSMSRKAFFMLYLICRHTSMMRVLASSCKTYVIPVLQYCSKVWSSYTKKCRSQIEEVERTIIKYLFYGCIHTLHSQGYSNDCLL